MNLTTYVREAVRTESKPTPELAARLDGATLRQLFACLSDFMLNSDDLDQLKKHIFYGREIESEIEEIDGFTFSLDFIRSPQNIRFLHAILGIITEAAELAEVYTKTSLGRQDSIDIVNLGEEAGDLLWYIAILFDTFNLNPPEVLQTNINKLRKRYLGSGKFSSEGALNRDLAAERTLLEDAASRTNSLLTITEALATDDELIAGINLDIERQFISGTHRGVLCTWGFPDGLLISADTQEPDLKEGTRSLKYYKLNGNIIRL